MKIYKPNKSEFINYMVTGIVLLPIIIFTLDKSTFTEKPFILLPLLSPVVLTLWTYFDTYYKIENGNFFYRCGFIRGEIEISTIKEIIQGKTMGNGTRAALSRNGFTVSHSKYHKAYIAPENNSEVISELLKLNPEIRAIQQKTVRT